MSTRRANFLHDNRGGHFNNRLRVLFNILKIEIKKSRLEFMSYVTNQHF